MISGSHVYLLTRNQNFIKSVPFYQAKHHETLAEKKNVISLSKNNKCISKYLTIKEENFLISITMMEIPFIPLIWKVEPVWNISGSPTHCMTRLITNHTPISKYRQRFSPNLLNTCLYSDSPIEKRSYILHDCKQYKKSWNPKWESLQDIYHKINYSLICNI